MTEDNKNTDKQCDIHVVNNSVFDCEKCGKIDKGGGIGGWSVNTKLWNRTLLNNGYTLKNKHGTLLGMLCIDCFEDMLGRKLNENDFTDTIDNKTSSVVQKYYY